ncbi:MAG: hypothetical protein ACI9OU_002800, partial [Candidatus Promineifilaceae bacterium]
MRPTFENDRWRTWWREPAAVEKEVYQMKTGSNMNSRITMTYILLSTAFAISIGH